MREIGKCFVVIILVMMIQIVSWVGATSRPIASSSHVTNFHPEHNSDRPILKSSEEDKEMEEKEKGRRIGSKPPSCEKKCYGCEPCEAVQVPTISSMPHLSPHYANYQPEGWRCHCAP